MSSTPAWIADAIAELPALATTDEVARVLRFSKRHLYRQLATGRLHAVRAGVGSSVRIPRRAVADYLASMENA